MELVICDKCGLPNTDKDKYCNFCVHLLSTGALDSASGQVSNGPRLPANLNLGEQVSMWSTTRSINCQVSTDDVQSGRRSSGTLMIDRCEFGLRIFVASDSSFIKIHYSQIAQTGYVAAVKIEEKNKSVLGRAAIGAVLLGPVGAIVGGISGTSKNRTSTDGLYIKFWDTKESRYEVLGMESSSASLQSFCSDIQRGAAQYQSLHR